MKLLAISDLHLNHEANWAALSRMPAFPKDWLIVAGDVAETAVTLTNQAANSYNLITVTDVTHGSAELWLIGPNSAELLSRLCGLDFHDSQFPSGTAKQSSVAKTTQLIIRRDLGEQPAYALIGGRSLAAYLWQTIMEAGQDLDIQPVGNAVLAEPGD